MGCSNIPETSLCKSLAVSLVSRKPGGLSHCSSVVFRKQRPILQARVSLPGSRYLGREEDIFDTKVWYCAYSFFLSFFLPVFRASYLLTVGIESYCCTLSL